MVNNRDEKEHFYIIRLKGVANNKLVKIMYKKNYNFFTKSINKLLICTS